MSLRVAVLSTRSKHHTYFLNRISPAAEIVAVLYERRRLEKPYATGPFFDDEQDAYEDRFFDPAVGGVEPELPRWLERRVVDVHDVNQLGVSQLLEALEPDVLVLFGTGLVRPHVYAVSRLGTINVHRGLVDRYRGLDSDLWACYHGDFDAIGVTIHLVDADLDTGPVLSSRPVPITAEDEIFHLRYRTTVAAADLVVDVLRCASARGELPCAVEQAATGPYYTAMSLDEKRLALARFTDHRAALRSAT